MAERIQGIEIFAVGTWRGNKKITVDSAGLDAMLASYEALGSTPGFRPPLVIGHGRTPGEMAYGWVERIYRVGDKVLADFTDVPEYLIYLMKERRYNSVSVEMYPSLDHQGKTFQNVLSAVAVLGAELPAVKGLKPLAESLFKDAGEAEMLTKEDDDMTTFTQAQVDQIVAAATQTTLTTAKAESDKEINAVKTAADAAVKTANEGRETAEAALNVFKRDAADKELNEFAEQAVKDGKVLPAQKDKLIALAKSMSGVIKFGDKEQSPLEVLKEFISEGTKKVDLSERGSNNPHPNSAKKAGDEVVRRATEEQGKDNKLSFQMAVEKVLAADPTLKQQYFQEV